MKKARIAVALLLGVLLMAELACEIGGEPALTPTVTPGITSTPTANTEWVGPDGESEYENVIVRDAYLVGADGHRIELFNNPEAKNPTWSELKAFLRQDRTDEYYYDEDSFVCSGFAEMLHNNAEEVGIRAAYVDVELEGEPSGHAANAFNTIDRGLLYIDCTGLREEDSYPCSCDTIVIIEMGLEYIAESIFPCSGWSSTWESIGRVTDVYIQW